MEPKKHSWILYLILATILTTIAVQFYWNYRNYEQNKQRVLNEIQLSLDNAVEQYYSNLSKKNFLTIVRPKNTTKKVSVTSIKLNNDDKKELQQATDSLLILSENIINEFDNKIESIRFTKPTKENEKKGTYLKNVKASKVKVFKGRKAADSLKLIKNIRAIFVSIHNDSLQTNQLDSILKKEFKNKKIDVTYSFEFYKKDTLKSKFTSASKFVIDNMIEAKSTFLGVDKSLKLFFENPTKEALKRSSIGILLSLLLSLSVILSLFYLLTIINKQKQLAEIKNDLISNITHEFKTPITTVSTALEAITNFDVINDKEKTKNYVVISKSQIQKLGLMVEKLLETATLDSKNLLLKKENSDVVHLLRNLAKKYQLTSDKDIVFNSTETKFYTMIDDFHFENAISNLIDNAIKYGGDRIEVNISCQENNLKIKIIDNGSGIEKQQQHKIFDKFYRVPKGNTHDVRGFGIGLYYTKKIVEKHNGRIDVSSNSERTSFTVYGLIKTNCN